MKMNLFVTFSVVLLLGACSSIPTIERFPNSQGNGGLQHPSLNKTSASFATYVDALQEPQLFSENETALQARLKLLDQVPPGGTAKVMTFVYDNGESTRLLAAHMCLAAKRGVKVEFMPDSKTGDRPGLADAFDANLHHQMNEEVYQMLANCGVEVRVHNHIPNFDVSVLTGAAIPQIPTGKFDAFLYQYVSQHLGRALSLEDLIPDLKEVIREAFTQAQGDLLGEQDREKLRSTVRTLILTAIKSYFAEPSSEERLRRLSEALDEIKTTWGTQSWSQEKTQAVRKLLYQVVKKVQTHPRLGQLYQQIRLFNRLNHRKLFWVSSDQRTCMFLGGRNLGDHYLTWGRHNDEFMDADVMICNHHLGAKNTNVLAQAENSFDQLWNNKDLEDPTGVPPQVKKVEPNFDYRYRYLKFPDFKDPAWGNPMWILTPYDSASDKWMFPKDDLSRSKGYADLKTTDRQVPAPTAWTDLNPIQAQALLDTFGWRLKTSTWNKQKDEVRQEIFRAIQNEHQEVYVETAYGEFSSDFRKHFEDALARGVKVRIVTNSIYVSDGPSKVIRLLLARWTRQMFEKYPALFSMQFATVEFGHMIHFKGASFQCQKNGSRLSRLNLIGSHNFHARSGYSDKEHALVWEQPPQASCREKVGIPGQVSAAADLRQLRDQYYNGLAKQVAPVQPLKSYLTFEEELSDGLKTGKLSGKRKKISEWALRLLYEHETDADGKTVLKRDQNGRAMLRAHDQFFRFLELLSESGLSDLVGTLM